MNNTKSVSEPIASASSSPGTSTAGTGKNNSDASSNSAADSNSKGRGNSAPDSNSYADNAGGDRTSEDDGEKENKDVTAR